MSSAFSLLYFSPSRRPTPYCYSWAVVQKIRVWSYWAAPMWSRVLLIKRNKHIFSCFVYVNVNWMSSGILAPKRSKKKWSSEAKVVNNSKESTFVCCCFDWTTSGMRVFVSASVAQSTLSECVYVWERCVLRWQMRGLHQYLNKALWHLFRLRPCWF